MAHTPYALIARITKTHGLHGEVVAVPAGDLTSIETLERVLLSENDGVPLKVFIVPPVAGVAKLAASEVRKTPKGLLVRFAGVDTIDMAQDLAAHSIMITRSDVDPELLQEDGNTSKPADFIGLAVYDEVYGELGEITEVIITGANDVWAVDGPYGEVLIPVIEQVVLGRDEDGTVVVRLLDGLLPGEAEEIENEIEEEE